MGFKTSARKNANHRLAREYCSLMSTSKNNKGFGIQPHYENSP
jgi:hypothetical protein